MRKYFLIYLSLILLWTCTNLASCKRLQMFTLYDDTGQSENYTSNVPDLTAVSNLVNSDTLTAVCSQVGVWAFFSTKNYTDQNAYGYHPATPNWTCNSRRIGADHGFAAVNSIRHLGSSDLDISALSLYSEPYFANEELYFDGEIISLPLTYTFNSYGFTGMDSWTLYANTNFTGDTTCLRRNSSDDSGVTYNTQRKLVVGSIVKGCFRTPRLLPIGEVFRDNETSIRNETMKPNTIKSHQCLELQDTLNTSISLFSGNELRFPEPEPYDSFTIQMNSTWTIYTGTDFNGDSMCLKIDSSEMNPKKEALNYHFVKAPYLIGSIRQGCEEQLEEPAPAQNTTTQSSTDLKPSDLTRTTTTAKPSNLTMENNSTHSSTTPSTVSTIAMTNSPESNTNSTAPPVTSNLPDIQNQTGQTNTAGSAKSPEPITNSTIMQNQNETKPTPILQNGTSTMQPTNLSYTQSTMSNPLGMTDSTENPDHQTETPTISTEPDDSTSFSISTAASLLNATNREDSSTRKGRVLNPNDTTEENDSKETDTETSTKPMDSEIMENVTSFSTSTQSTTTVEPNITSSKPINNQSLRNATIKPEELVSESGTGSLFFTAFIVVLGLLILCMVITLGLFVYFRATRHRNDEIPTE